MCDYTMDPSGDIIFTLSNPNAPFAVWDGDEPGPFQIEPTVKPYSIAEPIPPAEDNPITEDQQPAPQDSEASPQEDSQPSIPSTEPVTFLVSSRHLILASPVFKAMLTGGWKEGDKNNACFK